MYGPRQILVAILSVHCLACGGEAMAAGRYSANNHIPPRFQWNSNFGYCGEVSFVSAGLYFGQYVSQYDARRLASNGMNQSKYNSQLLVGGNDRRAAAKMHLMATEWDASAQTDTASFLAWVKKNVVKGYPVAIGIYMNQYLFYGNPNKNAGDRSYDHIVPVTGIGSNRPVTDKRYYGTDTITFSDNGIWDSAEGYFFTYAFGPFQKTRQQANARTGPIYSLRSDGRNYGIAITGVMDTNRDTVPVRVATDVNYERPQIKNGSNVRPAPMPLILTIIVSGLTPDVEYVLYRYNDMNLVPNQQFNANASYALRSWRFTITSGSEYTRTENIMSDEIAVYRAVPAAAP